MEVWLFSWVRMVIVCTVCIQLILLFITEEQYGKYVRMFLSMLFLMILFRPLLSVGDLEDRLHEELSDWSAKWEYKEAAAGRMADTPAEDVLVANAIRQKLKEDMEQFLLEQGMELLDIDCSIRLEENDADITRLSVTAAFAEGYSGASAKMEEMLKARLGKRYELSDEQIHIYIRQ